MTEQLDSLTAALKGRYTIERELGSGGMATVYLAKDLKHERKVAVQVVNAYDRRNVLVYAFDYAATPPTRTGTAQLPFFPTVGVELEW